MFCAIIDKNNNVLYTNKKEQKCSAFGIIK